MVDNLAVTPGTGATVGADLISTVLYQRVKLIYGDDGVNSGDVSTSNPFPCNVNQIGGASFALGQQLAAASLPVVLTAAQLTSLTTALTLGAGSAMIGAVTIPGLVTLTDTTAVTAGAYTTGQCVGGLRTLTSAFRTSGGSGTILSVGVTVKTALTAPFDVLFFGTNPTNSTFTDNAAVAVNVADLQAPVWTIHCTDLVSLGTPQLLQATNINIPIKNGSSNTSLYAVVVIRGAETFASTSAIGLNVQFQQN